MATTKRSPQKRWTCPRCGAGVNAPGRMLADDVRRFCLECSRATGRLVRRTCPALDRVREEKTARRVAKRTTKVKRARESVVDRRSIGGFDLLREAKRYWNLPALREIRNAGRKFPEIEFRRYKASTSMTSDGPARTSGHCYIGHRVVVTIGQEPAYALETTLHEIVHASCPYGAHHGDVFRTRLMAAAREAFPQARFAFADVNGKTSGYELDEIIRRGIRRWLTDQEATP